MTSTGVDSINSSFLYKCATFVFENNYVRARLSYNLSIVGLDSLCSSLLAISFKTVFQHDHTLMTEMSKKFKKTNLFLFSNYWFIRERNWFTIQILSFILNGYLILSHHVLPISIGCLAVISLYPIHQCQLVMPCSSGKYCGSYYPLQWTETNHGLVLISSHCHISLILISLRSSNSLVQSIRYVNHLCLFLSSVLCPETTSMFVATVVIVVDVQ